MMGPLIDQSYSHSTVGNPTRSLQSGVIDP
jgi:hypothetical protein